MRISVLAACSLLSACVFDPHRHARPARLGLGTHSRSFASTVAREPDVARTTTTSGPPPTVAQTFAGRFTMGSQLGLYAGFELETGVIANHGASFGGAYGVFGVEQAFGALAISGELASGWRGLRTRGATSFEDDVVIEPRVGGHLRLGPITSIGAQLGTIAGEAGSWMVGAFVSFHSLPSRR